MNIPDSCTDFENTKVIYWHPCRGSPVNNKVKHLKGAGKGEREK